MTIEAFLARQRRQALGLSPVAVVAFDDREFHVETAQTHQPHHIIDTDRSPARFPAGDGGLHETCPLGQLGLRQTRPQPGLANQLPAIGSHPPTITLSLYRGWVVPGRVPTDAALAIHLLLPITLSENVVLAAAWQENLGPGEVVRLRGGRVRGSGCSRRRRWG